jgi:AcrR family transcriptional regulator
MDDIAEAAGVTKPLVYQHFSSKRALYLELVNSIAQELLIAVRAGVMQARGPRQQVEMGFAAYFSLVISREDEFRLLYGRDHADDEELGRALRTVEDAIAEAIDPLIDAGLDDDHRRLRGRRHGRGSQPPVHGAAAVGRQGGRGGGPTAGPTHRRPGVGRPAIGPRRLRGRAD